MIRLGIRLALASVRAAPFRSLLAISGGGVAVLVLFGALSIEPALDRQRTREQRRAVPLDVDVGDASLGTLLWAPSANAQPIGQGDQLLTIAVAAVGPAPPRPLGAQRPPAAGEVLVSPELMRFLGRDENAVHRLRVPGRIVGNLAREALGPPDELVMMAGWDADELRRARPTTLVELHGVPTEAASRVNRVSNLQGRVLNIVLGVALLIPMLVFVRIAGRVADTRRRARLAALDLVGASPTQLRVLAGCEVALLSMLSLAVAAVVLAASSSSVSEIHVAGTAFFTDDLRPPWWQVVALALLLPLLSYASVRRSTPSPAAARRAVNTVRYRWLRPLPALGGLAILLAVSDKDGDRSAATTEVVIGVGLTLVVLGFVLLVPLGMLAATALVAKVGTRPSFVLATGSMRAYASSRARATAGVVGAVLAATMAAVYFPSHDAWQRVGDSHVASGTAVTDAVVTVNGSAADPGLVDQLRSIDGVDAALPVVPIVRGGPGSFAAAIVGSCAVISEVLTGIACDGEEAGAWAADAGLSGRADLALSGGATFAGEVVRVERSLARLFPPVAYVLPEASVRGPVAATRFLIGTDGTAAAAERLRGWLAATRGPDFHVLAATDRPVDAPSRNERDYVKAQLVTLFLAAVATASVALAQGAAILERRREMSLLLATGVPAATLRRAVLVEAVAPLLGLALGAAACGAGIAWVVLESVDIAFHLALRDLAFVGLTVLGPALLALVLVLPLVPDSIAPSALRTE